MLKPAPETAETPISTADQTPTNQKKTARTSSGHNDAPTAIHDPSGEKSTEEPAAELTEAEREEQRAEQRREWQAQMAQRMQERQQGQFDRQVEELTAKLNLNPEQSAQLKALFDAKLQAYSDLTGKGFEAMRNPETVQQLASILGEEDVNNTLASILSPEQNQEYTALKERERTNKIEASTMQNMASLQSSLDLSDEQKDAVYAVLYEQAAQKANNPSPYETVANSMGGGRWFSGQQLEDHLSISASNNGEEVDREKRMAQFQALQEKRINEQVHTMEGVLNEPQLESYRELLQQNQFRGRGGRGRGRR